MWDKEEVLEGSFIESQKGSGFGGGGIWEVVVVGVTQWYTVKHLWS